MIVLVFISYNIFLLFPQIHKLLVLFLVVQNQVCKLIVKNVFAGSCKHFSNADLFDMWDLAQH
jgi:hypothetical protein